MQLDEIREWYAQDAFATENGMTIEEAHEGYARCSFAIAAGHKNARGAVQGGAIFTLGDFAFAVAAGCGKEKAVSLSVSISYMKQPKGTMLIAEAKKVHSGRTVCFYEVDIHDELGNAVAIMTVNGFIVERSE